MPSTSPPTGDSLLHPRTVGWFGTTAVAMGGINQSLFLLSALFVGQSLIPGQGSAAVPLLAVGLLLAWMATPGWTELILMYPNRVGGIAATCAEAFRPYSPVLANLTGVCYWWGWVPTCGLTALLASSALNQWYLPQVPVPVLATVIVLFFTAVNLCGVKWVMRLAAPLATVSALLAFLSALIPVFSGTVDWQQALTFKLTVPFEGWFGQLTSVMAGLYLIGFAAPAFEQAACHVGETIDPNKNVPRAMFVSAGLASLYFVALPVIWLGTLGPETLSKELALELGPTFAPLLGATAKAAALWFMIFNMLHGTLAPLAGASRTLAQLSEDGLLPEALGRRSRTDVPWVATLLTAGMSIAFLLIGDPIWLIAAANLTYLIGIALPSVAVWLLRRNEPDLPRPYRAPRGCIVLGLVAAACWALTVVLGFQQFGMWTVLIGIAFAYSGSVLYAWRKYSDRKRAGLPGVARTLHLKLTGAMLLVLVLDAAGYLVAVAHVPTQDAALIAMLEDIFVAVALLTIAVGLILPGMIAHSAVQVSEATDRLVKGTLADFTRAMRALAAGDLDSAKARLDLQPVKVYSKDEVGDMALNFNQLQLEIGRAADGLVGAREGLLQSRTAITEVNQRLSAALAAAAVTLNELKSQKQALDEHSIVGVTDIRGRIIDANDRFCAISGYAREELLGQDHRVINSGHHPSAFFAQLWATIGGGQVWRGEIKNRAKQGSVYWVETTIVPFLDMQGQTECYVAIRSDITARKNNNDALLASLREKEALLREVHHRVKNNLQVVTSLLRLEAGRIEHPLTQNVLREMQGRIRAMSLLHETIYGSASYAQLDLATYLHSVVTQLFRALEGQPGHITQQLELEPLHIGLDQAILCGLIVNELASNCLKHAFPSGRGGAVRVQLLATGDGKTVRLCVSDDGVGLPEDFQARCDAALGLQLVGELVGQLMGTMAVGPGRAAVFAVSFTPLGS